MRIVPINNAEELPLPDVVCRTCTEPLVRRRSSAGEISWKHGGSGDRDHEVEPMPRSEAESVKLTCDFCCVNEPVWSYRTKEPLTLSIQSPNLSEELETQQISRGSKHGRRTIVKRHKEADATDLIETVDAQPWAACAECAELVELRDVNRLVTRVHRTNPRLATESTKRLKTFYQPFMRSIAHRTEITSG
ncbi:hypothetical protein [Nocardia sp. NRRL S-836]|uniref:hypothetical protein n=1 Tax=Nocardia sp. NRRL S-836 TaxID=1519492 RepID=UPI0006AF3D2E|nr:hypothetical protein [Nocardia sp. NRRL S-836]KOV77448.1 hypothetical protein ADL03_41710 [Nocardia sp. NRRL S-836]